MGNERVGVVNLAMNRKHWMLGIVMGLGGGLTVAVIMTFLDWRINPDGLFHDANGTHWPVVLETAFSWFAPATLFVGITAWVALFAIAHIKD